jgi:AAA ATPase-like protein
MLPVTSPTNSPAVEKLAYREWIGTLALRGSGCGGGERALEARAATVSGEAVFVGRERELRLLGGCLERALAGTGSLVLVAGDPGIGKTRTLGEFVATARVRGALALWGSSFEGDDATSYALRQGLADHGDRGVPLITRRREVEAIPRWQAPTRGTGCP